MKLKKLSAVLTAMLCACSISAPVIQTNAVDEFSENSLVDVITLHKWLKGQGSLEDWKRFDYNHDEKINIFDFVLMKNHIFKSAKPIVSPEQEQPAFYGAKYIRHNDVEYGSENSYHVIRNHKELESFITARCESVSMNSTICELENQLAYYNTEFFETHDLIIVSIEEGSGSISHEVQGITADENNNWTVTINRNIPLQGTCDMASWAIFVETNKAVESAKSVTIDWVNTYSDEWYQEGILERTVELSKDMQSQEVTGKQADENFINGQTKFALELFQNEVSASKNNQNVMVSGYSVVQAFGMLANGADGDTKTQIEQTIGSMPIEDLNQYLYTQRTTQPNDETCKLSTANSIWIRDDIERIQVKENFLQTNADYYNASVFKAPFDGSTVNDINSWVKKNTDDMIPELLDGIPDDAVMYLINAIAFDGKWAVSYKDSDIKNKIFTSADGSEQTAEMMYSEEYYYLEDENTTGFYKYYDGNRYAFVALLPDEEISINNYIADLTPESFQNLISNPESISVEVGLPKFSFDYDTVLNDTLVTMGIHDAFGNANFSKLADTSLSVSKVRHKTFIDVSETGTKAAAVTSIEMNDGCALIEQKSVILDRPFVYAIVDTDTNLPIFMGVLNSIPEE